MTKDEGNFGWLPGWLRYELKKETEEQLVTQPAPKVAIRPMNPNATIHAKTISDELWRQRMTMGEDASITLRGAAMEGLEKVLFYLAEQRYEDANAAASLLVRGLLDDAPGWRGDWDEVEEKA